MRQEVARVDVAGVRLLVIRDRSRMRLVVEDNDLVDAEDGQSSSQLTGEGRLDIMSQGTIGADKTTDESARWISTATGKPPRGSSERAYTGPCTRTSGSVKER